MATCKTLLIRSFVIAAVCCLLSSTQVSADRGRPGLLYKTLVTDAGRLLRGSRWSTDFNGGSLPDRTWVTGIRNKGLNSLHLYAEAPGYGYAPGSLATQIDTLVDWTAQDGLYLIITIGNVANQGGYDYNFARGFWNFYAPRYKNRTHVIYEIYNEPQVDVSTWTSQPSSSATLQLERDMYTLIRTYAPSTPVLLFSYGLFSNGPAVLQDVQALGSTVNWSNAAIAFHGYSSLTDIKNTLAYVKNAGYPCIQTEFFNTSNNAQDVPQTEYYEDSRTSWMTFLLLDATLDDTRFKNPLDQGWIVWVADYGTWPATSTPPLNQTVAIKATVNGKWVTAGSGPLIANKDTIGTSEKYLVVSMVGGYYVGLQAKVNNYFVDADSFNSYYLIANFANPKKFEWMNRPDGTVALKAVINNKFVSADLNLANPPKLIANRTTAGPWEWFAVSVTP
ncbi:MAG TPA: cellulase family glycosylhydrolase [Thermoanaerobaculia bacterium]|jgi:hypothetical protein